MGGSVNVGTVTQAVRKAVVRRASEEGGRVVARDGDGRVGRDVARVSSGGEGGA